MCGTQHPPSLQYHTRNSTGTKLVPNKQSCLHVRPKRVLHRPLSYSPVTNMAIDIPPVPSLRSLQDYVGAEDNHPSEIDLGTVEEAWKLSVLNVMKLALTIFRSTVFSSSLLSSLSWGNEHQLYITGGVDTFFSQCISGLERKIKWHSHINDSWLLTIRKIEHRSATDVAFILFHLLPEPNGQKALVEFLCASDGLNFSS
jgi:hypothetical protein